MARLLEEDKHADKESDALRSIRPDLPGSHDDLGVDPEQRKSESDDLQRQFDAPSAPEPDLKSAEESAEDGVSKSNADQKETDQIGQGYREENESRAGSRVRKFFGSKRNRWIGVGVGGSIVGIGMFGFFLLPLKVMHVAENLQSTFFSSSEEAAETMTNRLIAGYVIQKVMPGMTGDCRSTLNVNKSCAVVSEDDNFVSKLYRAWRDNNLEGKLADKYGLEIRREGGRYFVRSGDKTLFSGVRDEKNPAEFENRMFSEMDRKDVRKEFLRAIEQETFFKRIMYRYKFGKLIERKYGVVRCLIACDYRNDRAEKKELKKLKFKAWFVDRILVPMNTTYGLAFECALGGFQCAEESSYETSEDGDRRSKFETDVRAAVGQAIGDGRMTKEKLAKAQQNIEDIRRGGLSNHLFSKIFGPAFTKVTGSVLSGVGILDTVARIVQASGAAGTAIVTMDSVIKSGPFVHSYMMYRTNADEIKDGGVSAEEVGYVADSLGEDFGTDQAGGGAESSPYYQDVMGTQRTRSASILPKVQAVAPYKCNDGSTVTSGLCPEMTLGAVTKGGDALKSFSELIKSIPGLAELADFWLSTGGKIFDVAGDLLGGLLGLITPEFIEEKLAELGKILADWITSKLFINPIGENPSGGRMFDAAAMGANISGNDYAHYGLGAGKISDRAANDIRYARIMQDEKEFQNKSFFARMFDTSSSRSMVSKLALATPARSELSTSLASTLLNPLGGLSASLSGATTVSAAPIKDLDLGGVTQYGYPADSPIFKVTDYEKYWSENACDDEEQFKSWGDSAKISEANGMPIHDTSYPCKLLESAVSMNGALYDDSFLTDQERGINSSDPGNTELGNVPEWTELPNVNAPIGGPVNGVINVVSANIKNGNSVPPSLNTIKSKNPDFITLNEVGDSTTAAMENAAPGYGAYRDPKRDDTVGGVQSQNNVIMWNKDKWKLLDSGRMKITNDDKGFLQPGNKKFVWDRYATWGVLQRNDGAIVSLISTHMMTNPKRFPQQWDNPPMSRVEQYSQSMDILLQLTAVLARHGPVIIGGDMNSHPDEGPHTAAAKFKNAGFDYAKDQGVMYIFHPEKSKLVSSGQFSIPSDHPALQARIDMNGVGPNAIKNVSLDGSSGGELSWPLGENHWKAHRSDYLDAHGSTGTAWGEDNMGTSGKGAYIASDIGAPVGTKVYAILGGTVTSTNLCGENDGIAIKSTVTGGTVGIAYMHGINKKFKKGDTVKSGDYIMDVGTKGCNVTGAHLHVGMAFNGKYICPSDVFLAMSINNPVSWSKLPGRTSTCQRL